MHCYEDWKIVYSTAAVPLDNMLIKVCMTSPSVLAGSSWCSRLTGHGPTKADETSHLTHSALANNQICTLLKGSLFLFRAEAQLVKNSTLIV